MSNCGFGALLKGTPTTTRTPFMVCPHWGSNREPSVNQELLGLHGDPVALDLMDRRVWTLPLPTLWGHLHLQFSQKFKYQVRNSLIFIEQLFLASTLHLESLSFSQRLLSDLEETADVSGWRGAVRLQPQQWSNECSEHLGNS